MSSNYSNGPAADQPTAALAEEYDLRGVACPLSWAKAKVRLEQLPREALLILRLDDPKGARDLPRAAESEGYAVVEVIRESSEWRILLQK